MKRSAAALVVSAAVAALWPSAPVSACSCFARSREQLIAAADVVFVGRAIAVRADQTADRALRGMFEIASVYKGSVDRRVAVRTAADPATCGAAFLPGHRYAVFASRATGSLATDLCMGTTQDVSMLDGLAPISTASSPAPNPPSGSRIVPILIACVLAAAVAAVRRRIAR